MEGHECGDITFNVRIPSRNEACPDIMNDRTSMDETLQAELVGSDICQYLRDSDVESQIDFVIEHDKFWHLRPKLPERVNYQPNMDTLQRLLGENFRNSSMAKSDPREQLVLCYILANSMLYLYPSSWLQLEWDSSMIYITNRSGNSLPHLTAPYIGVELLTPKKPKSEVHHMQYHIHPAILALGIIFLEIVSGTPFRKSREDLYWKRWNEDNREASRLLKSLEEEDQRNGTKRISSHLGKTIRACLKLEPPANFPSNELSEEGPIRHYILTCIVWPLAYELQYGYKISLSDLHKSFALDVEGDRPSSRGNSQSTTSTSNERSQHHEEAGMYMFDSVCTTMIDFFKHVPSALKVNRKFPFLFEARSSRNKTLRVCSGHEKKL